MKSLLSEAAVWWRETPDKGRFGVLLAAWVALFHFLGNSTFGYFKGASLFLWMRHVFAHSPDDDLCSYVPFVVLVLLFLKRRELMAIPKQPSWGALAFVGAGVVLHLVGFAVQQTRVSIIAFVLGLYGLTGVVWGAEWLRRTFFPMCLLLFLVPFAAVSDGFTLPLRLLATKLAVGVSSGVLGIPVSQNGSQILGLEGKPLYEVAPACSGIRSLTSLTLLMLIYAFTTFRTGWKRLVILLLGVPVAIAGNGLRLIVVIIVGEVVGPDAASAIEQNLGFVTFALGLGCMLLVGHWLREPASGPAAPTPVPEQSA